MISFRERRVRGHRRNAAGKRHPDEWPSLPGDRRERIRRLCSWVEQLSELDAAELVDALSWVKHPVSTRQQTHQLVIDAVHRCGLSRPVTAEAVIEAMCLPAAGHVELFPDAHRMLDTLSGRARVVIVSNTIWRDRRAVRGDLEQVGFAGQVNDYVMSIDVGWRKPDARFFAALSSGGAPPDHCVIVGDSETNDIAPAQALGMGTIRVAIEAPRPSASSANHVCTSLDQVADVLVDRLAGRAG